MKVVILAGGFGTRLGEATSSMPKPMVTVGEKPILWHIMNLYSAQGYNEFIILLGYKGYMIKEYFKNFLWHENDVTIDIRNNSFEFHNQQAHNWKVTLLDTGQDTMTGGRVFRAREHIGNEPFMLTYGDGVSDINLAELLRFHKSHGRVATMTTVQPDGRFGAFEDKDGLVTKFVEKPKGDGSWINGGFFVMEPEFFDYILDGDASVLEEGPLGLLTEKRQLMVYNHTGFWKCMDTPKDKSILDDLWINDAAPWRIW